MSQRRDLPITALFLASSLAVAITVGFSLGTWLLLHATMRVPFADTAWLALVEVHGHAQLVGFAGLLVIGIACRILPRFRGADDPRAREVLVVFALVAGGLLLRPAQVLADSPARHALLFLSGAAELAGMLLYARLAFRTLASGTNDHRADEVFLAAGAGMGVVGATWDLVALAPAIAGGASVDPDADGAAIAALLLGFIAAHVIGVSLRVAPAFIASAPPRQRTVVICAGLWLAGVTLTTLGGPIGPTVLLLTAVALVREIGPFSPGAAVRPLPASARLVRLAFRGAYAWLAVGLALLVAGATNDPTGSIAVAGRHALALGFLTQIVFGVGSRLIPALTGAGALHLPTVRAAILLVNAATFLRVAFELVGASTTVASLALAASGPLALAALLVFAAAASRSVRAALVA